MSEIELLIETLSTLNETSRMYSNMAFIICIGAFCSGLVSLVSFTDNNKTLGFVFLAITLGCLVGLVGSVEQMNLTNDEKAIIELEIDQFYKERDQQRKNLVLGMDCDTLRLNTLSLLETDQELYIEKTLDWQQDYYDLKCETPLRDEVLKLQ